MATQGASAAAGSLRDRCFPAAGSGAVSAAPENALVPVCRKNRHAAGWPLKWPRGRMTRKITKYKNFVSLLRGLFGSPFGSPFGTPFGTPAAPLGPPLGPPRLLWRLPWLSHFGSNPCSRRTSPCSRRSSRAPFVCFAPCALVLLAPSPCFPLLILLLSISFCQQISSLTTICPYSSKTL